MQSTIWNDVPYRKFKKLVNVLFLKNLEAAALMYWTYLSCPILTKFAFKNTKAFIASSVNLLQIFETIFPGIDFTIVKTLYTHFTSLVFVFRLIAIVLLVINFTVNNKNVLIILLDNSPGYFYCLEVGQVFRNFLTQEILNPTCKNRQQWQSKAFWT